MMRALLLCLLLLTACDYSVEKRSPGGATTGPKPTPGGGGTQPDPGMEMNFAAVFSFSIEPVCLECHSAPGNAVGINLESYASVFQNRLAIESALSSRFMPDSVGRAYSEEQRSFFLAWLAAGAPETSVSQQPNGGTQ